MLQPHRGPAFEPFVLHLARTRVVEAKINTRVIVELCGTLHKDTDNILQKKACKKEFCLMKYPLVREFSHRVTLKWLHSVADLEGVQGMRVPSLDQNFIFLQFSGKNGRIVGWRPPLNFGVSP